MSHWISNEWLDMSRSDSDFRRENMNLKSKIAQLMSELDNRNKKLISVQKELDTAKRDIGLYETAAFHLAQANTAAMAQDKTPSIDNIKAVYYSDKPGKEKTIIVFNDGTKSVVNLHEGDTFDLNIGFALCLCEKLFGGKTKFHKAVKKFANISDKK